MAFRNRNNQTEATANGADTNTPSTSYPAAYQEVASNQPSPPTSPAVLSESSAMARDLKDGTLSGFLGTGIELKGEAQFKEMMRIDGHFSGKINSQDGKLIVGDNGLIDADVNVAIAQIQGTVNGNVKATQRIELGHDSKVIGNIQTPELTIEQGAVFDGNCRMTK